MTASALLQFVITGVTVGSVYALVALGFTLIYNATGVINFAQGEFVAIGGLLFFTFFEVWHWPLLVALTAAVVLVALLGMGVERLGIRPLANGPAISLVIVTIGLSVVLRGLAKVVWGVDSHAVTPFSGDRSLELGGAVLQVQYLWVLGLAGVTVLAVKLFFDHTLTGKAMRACAINPEAARLVGISVPRMVQASFALSAGLSALAGVVVSPVIFPGYDGGLTLGLKGFCGAIIGGLGNGMGAVAGGLLVGLLENLGVGLAPAGLAGFQDAFAFIVLVLVLFVRPTGLLARRGAEGG